MKFLVSKKDFIKKKKNTFPRDFKLKKKITHSFFCSKNLLHVKKNCCIKFAYFYENSFYKINKKKEEENFFSEIFEKKKRFLELKWKKKGRKMNFFKDSVKIFLEKIFSFKFICFYPKKKYSNPYEDREEISPEINKFFLIDERKNWIKKEKINKKIVEVLLKFLSYSTQSNLKSPTLLDLIFPQILF
jgi:hypothetical protein